MRGLSLVAASGGHSSSLCAGLSLSQPLPLRSTGSRRTGSVVVAHGPSCSAACGIFPDQGSNPCPLHWQADSQPLCHQGSPHLLEFWRRDLGPLSFCVALRKTGIALASASTGKLSLPLLLFFSSLLSSGSVHSLSLSLGASSLCSWALSGRPRSAGLCSLASSLKMDVFP